MTMLRCLALLFALAAAAAQADETETLVCFRHAEKPPGETGQLNVKGLNRSLALPAVLLGRFGKPQYIFAPDPAIDLVSKNGGPAYDYLRPLATVEPTAIRCGLPVNTSFGFLHIAELETELRQPRYHGALIYVCWEHGQLAQMLAQFLADIRGVAPEPIVWPRPDFDSIYILRIHYFDNGAVTATLTHQLEGLNGQSEAFPRPAS